MNEVKTFEEKAREIQRQIMEEDEPDAMYDILIDLQFEVSALHKRMNGAETVTEQSDMKGQLSILYSLIEVCQNRMNDIRDINGRMNHNFRMAAKDVLDKETYRKIWNEARKPRQKKVEDENGD
jgi:hypothetical protein